MKMPPPVEAYFAADRRHDETALAQVFSTDAFVQDEGRRHDGIEAILAWWRQVHAKYAHRVDPQAVEAEGTRIQVRARVTGSFPGSPIACVYTFQLRGERVGQMEITA